MRALAAGAVLRAAERLCTAGRGLLDAEEEEKEGAAERRLWSEGPPLTVWRAPLQGQQPHHRLFRL